MNPIKVINRTLTALVTSGALLCLGFGTILSWWGMDRQPPFILENYTVDDAFPGKTTIIVANVERDLDRRCSVVFSRTFIDSKGTRFELTDGVQFMNALSLAAYNERSPDVLAFPVVIPIAASYGQGSVITSLNYECNPIHQFFPIAMALKMDVTVLKPLKG